MQVRGLVRAATVARMLGERPGCRGAQALRALVDAADAPTRSVFEDRFLSVCRRHRVPPPLVNQRVAGYEVDMLWPRQRFIVELDGRAAHRTPQAFERDRARDGVLLEAGYGVLRITWQRLHREPAREAGRLRRILARRSST
jgi:very-short-patch-repair endonuclease